MLVTSKIFIFALVVGVVSNIATNFAECRSLLLSELAKKKNLSSRARNLLPTTSPSPSGTYSCPGLDGYSIQCRDDLSCCTGEGGGMQPQCYDNSTKQCCEWWISSTLCELSQSCCGALGTGASSSAFCCAAGSECCRTQEDGESQCCSKDEICCTGENSYCCDRDGGSCCGGSCCSKGQSCCGADVCCDDTTQFCDSTTLSCQWITQYPTYAPGVRPRPFDIIWHLNATNGSTLPIHSSPTSDFIVAGTFASPPTISRLNGVTGDPLWSTAFPAAKYDNGQMYLAPVINEAANLIFNFGVGFDLASGKILYDASPQFAAACPLADAGNAPQIAYQTASVMTFYCWEPTIVSFVFATFAATTGAIVGQYRPAAYLRNGDSTVSPTTAGSARTNAVIAVNSNNNNLPSVVGVDALTSKKIFEVDSGIPFLQGWDANLVNPIYYSDRNYMVSSSPVSTISNALGIFLVQQSSTLFGLSATSGQLLWTVNNAYSWTSVLPFALPPATVAAAKANRRNLLKSMGASSDKLVAWVNMNGHVEIRDQYSGNLLWTSTKNVTVAGGGAVEFGSSKNFIFGRSTGTIFAIDISASSSSSSDTPAFSLRWENTGSVAAFAGSCFTSPNSPFLFVQSGNTLNVLSPADGSVVHAWELLPQDSVESVYVDSQQKTVRVALSSTSINLYEL